MLLHVLLDRKKEEREISSMKISKCMKRDEENK